MWKLILVLVTITTTLVTTTSTLCNTCEKSLNQIDQSFFEVMQDLWNNLVKLILILQDSSGRTKDLKIRKIGSNHVRSARSSVKKFSMNDVHVPPEFLRIEYMISYTFLGTMYGLGFLVLYQSILVPLTKCLIAKLYVWFLWLELIDPITIQQAIQQIPPT